MIRPVRAPATSGFTLLEVLVVLVVIGIIVNFGILSLGGGDRRAEELKTEAERLQALLTLASEQAVLRAEEWALEIVEDGYGFIVLGEDEWRPLADDSVLRERRLDRDIELELWLEGREVDLEPEPAQQPMVLLLSSGESTPFELYLSAPETETLLLVQGDGFAQFRWETVEE